MDGSIANKKAANNKPKPNQTPSASASASTGPSESPSPSPSASHDIASRSTDPRPVTTDELFGKATVTYNGRTFTRLGVEAPNTCTKATSAPPSMGTGSRRPRGTWTTFRRRRPDLCWPRAEWRSWA